MDSGRGETNCLAKNSARRVPVPRLDHQAGDEDVIGQRQRGVDLREKKAIVSLQCLAWKNEMDIKMSKCLFRSIPHYNTLEQTIIKQTNNKTVMQCCLTHQSCLLM